MDPTIPGLTLNSLPLPIAGQQGPWDPNAPPDWRDPPPGMPASPFPDVRGLHPPMPQGYPRGYTPPNPQPYLNAQAMPMPSWMSPTLQRYIQSRPTFAEGERPGPQVGIAGEPWGPGTPPVQAEPYSPTPQIEDIQRLFGQGIAARNRRFNPVWSQQLRAFMKQPGFSGLVGGSAI